MAATDPSKFNELVRTHHAAVFRSAQRVTGDADAAADVVQDVFLRVLRGRQKLDRAENVRAVLCWLGTRLARNHVRAARRRQAREDRTMTDHDSVSSAHDSGTDPAEAAADRDLLQKLAALVARLPRDLRLPLQLRCEDDLTFSAIGTALAISESTAHDRYERALARLRNDLGDRTRYGATAVPIAELLRGNPLPPAPAGLEARLLELGHASVLSTVSIARRVALVCVSATVVVAVAVGAAFGIGDEPRPVEPTAGAAAAVADPEPVTEVGAGAVAARDRVAVAPAADAGRDLTAALVPGTAGRQVVTGTVHDAGNFPVAMARVVVVAGGGLKPFKLGSTTTDAEGTFEVELDGGKIGLRRGAFKVRVFEGARRLHETADIALPRAADAEPLAIVLPAAAGTAATRFELAVTVLDANGAPVAAVPVKALPVPVFPDGAESEQRPYLHGRREPDATTDARGCAVISGRKPGPMWLYVDGREAGHTARCDRHLVVGPGRSAATVRLAAAATVTVEFSVVDDGTMPHRPSLWMIAADGVQHQAEVGGDRVAQFTNVSPIAHTLKVSGYPWSGVELVDVVPRDEPYRIELKRGDDARDVGDHMAEIHGSLVDAATGEVVPYGAFEVEFYEGPALGSSVGSSTIATDCCPPPPPVQRSAGPGKQTTFGKTHLTAGRWVLVATVDGYAATAHEFVLERNQLLADVEVPLRRGATVSGRIVDENGEPMSRVQVRVVGVGPAADAVLERARALSRSGGKRASWPSVGLVGTWTQKDGTFTLTGIPPDTAVRIVAWRLDTGLAVTAPNVYRSAADVDDFVLRLPAGR